MFLFTRTSSLAVVTSSLLLGAKGWLAVADLLSRGWGHTFASREMRSSRGHAQKEALEQVI